MSEQIDVWPGGITYLAFLTVINDESNSGNHTYIFTPGVGNEFQIMWLRIENRDSVARTVFADILDDGGNVSITLVEGVSAAAAASRSWPAAEASSDGNAISGGTPVFVSGTMELRLQVTAVAVSQDSRISVGLRIRGAAPTIAITSPTGANEVTTTDRTF